MPLDFRPASWKRFVDGSAAAKRFAETKAAEDPAWYIRRGTHLFRLETDEELKAKCATRRVFKSDEIFHRDIGSWVTAGELPLLRDEFSAITKNDGCNLVMGLAVVLAAVCIVVGRGWLAQQGVTVGSAISGILILADEIIPFIWGWVYRHILLILVAVLLWQVIEVKYMLLRVELRSIREIKERLESIELLLGGVKTPNREAAIWHEE